MKKIISLILGVVLAGMTFGCTEYHAQGAGTGAVIGGITGALIDHRHPWRGGVIGGALGAVAGATVADISMKASQEAARTRRPVEYRTEDGRGVYRADPLSYDKHTKCRKVREMVWDNNVLIKNQTREICEGVKNERRY